MRVRFALRSLVDEPTVLVAVGAMFARCPRSICQMSSSMVHVNVRRETSGWSSSMR